MEVPPHPPPPLDPPPQDYYDTDDDGMTPLHHAAEASGYCQRAVIATRQLIEVSRSSQDLNLKIRGGRKVGYTALHLLCNGSDQSFWRAYLAAFMVVRGADKEARDLKGNTALLHAVGAGVADVVEELITRGADVHARNNKGHGVWDRAGSSGTVKRVLRQARVLRERGPEDEDHGATGQGWARRRLVVGNSRMTRYMWSFRDPDNARWFGRR